MNTRVEPLRAGLAILTTLGLVIAMLMVFTGPAAATHLEPIPIAGNENCNAATGLVEVLRLEGSELADGTYPFDVGTGSVTIDISDDKTSFDWTSTELIAAIFVKGGNSGNLYDYRPDGAISDTGLVAPLGPQEQATEISHITFCTPAASTTTTTTTVADTTTTTVADTTTTTVADTTTTTIEDEVLGTTITTSTTAPVVEVTTTIVDEVLDTSVEAEELPFTGIDSDQLVGMAVLLLAGGLALLGVTGKREDA